MRKAPHKAYSWPTGQGAASLAAHVNPRLVDHRRGATNSRNATLPVMRRKPLNACHSLRTKGHSRNVGAPRAREKGPNQMVETTSTNDLRVQRFHPAPNAAARLACFSYAGGAASFYFPTSQALSPTVEVLAIQYPGRHDRHAEPALTDISALADGITDALSAWTDRPLAFFGHSMGWLVAYEVAQRLIGARCHVVRPDRFERSCAPSLAQ